MPVMRTSTIAFLSEILTSSLAVPLGTRIRRGLLFLSCFLNDEDNDAALPAADERKGSSLSLSLSLAAERREAVCLPSTKPSAPTVPAVSSVMVAASSPSPSVRDAESCGSCAMVAVLCTNQRNVERGGY